ncbi:hypothetical protein GQ457_10G019080 [Hibiscus cannabinus]
MVGVATSRTEKWEKIQSSSTLHWPFSSSISSLIPLRNTPPTTATAASSSAFPPPSPTPPITSPLLLTPSSPRSSAAVKTTSGRSSTWSIPVLSFYSTPLPPKESQPELDGFLNAEDYLNDGDKFNITDRLVLLFPKIDVDPADGFVTENELIEWHLQQAMKEVWFRSLREMEIHDKNNDGLISYAEYEAPSWVKNDNPSFGLNIGWWTEDHFNASDANGDHLLNLTEFNDFMHPADSKNPKLLQWLCKEEVRERDADKDGKVNFNEFFHGIFDLVISHDEEGHISMETETPAKRLFSQLDIDGDRFLTDEELLPIIGKLHPSERYYAKQQAGYIISQTDLNGDGRLSLVEMIDNPYVFYSAIFNDGEDDYKHHDEFR